MNQSSVGFVRIGPAWHGVTRFGRTLEEAAGRITPIATIRRHACGALDPATHPNHVTPAGSPITTWYVQFTDHLLGATPERAASEMTSLRERLAPARLVTTLHDLPGPTSTPARRAAYREVAEAAGTVVVCSAHERALLRECSFDGPVTVIPHFVESRPAVSVGARHGGTPATVGVLGFLYPGKGHLAVLRACARATADVGLVALGGPSPGHADLVEQLLTEGRRLGVECTVTGWLDEEELDERLASVDVPVTAHEAISASSSVATWIAAGRRPIVPSGPYMDELLAGAPGIVTTYDAGDPGALAARIDAAVDDATTTCHAAVPSHLSVDATVRRYLALAG